MALIYKFNLSMIAFCVLFCKILVSGNKIDFSKQELTKVPSIPDQIPTDTEILDLSSNNISFVSSVDFKGLIKINNLGLMYNFLTVFPNLLSVSDTLTFLSVGFNKINYIPAENLDILKNIQLLDIQGNQLTSIPDVDGPSNTLTLLNLPKNLFEYFPFLYRLGKSVTTLWLDENHIREVDAKALQLLKKLETLHLQKNQLKTIAIPATSKLNTFTLTIYQNPLVCDPHLAWLLVDGLIVSGSCDSPEHLKGNRTNTLSLEDLGIVNGNTRMAFLLHCCRI